MMVMAFVMVMMTMIMAMMMPMMMIAAVFSDLRAIRKMPSEAATIKAAKRRMGTGSPIRPRLLQAIQLGPELQNLLIAHLQWCAQDYSRQEEEEEGLVRGATVGPNATM